MNKLGQSISEMEYTLDETPEPWSRQTEGWGETVGRNVIRAGSNIASMAGIPQDIATFVSNTARRAGRPKLLEPDEETFNKSIAKETPRYQELVRQERKELDTIPGRRQATESAFDTSKNALPLLPTGQEIKDSIGHPFPKDYLKAEGMGEELIDRMSYDVPLATLAALSGGWASAGPVVAKAALGNVAQQTTKELGGGPIAELIAGLAAASSYDLRKGFGTQEVRKGIDITQKPKLELHLKGTEQALRDQVKLAGKEIDVPTKDLALALRPERKRLEGQASRLSQADKAIALEELTNIDNLSKTRVPKTTLYDFTDRAIVPEELGTANLNKLIRQKVHLNGRIRSTKLTNPVESDYYMRMVGAINETIQEFPNQFVKDSVEYKDAANVLKKFNSAEHITKSLGKFEEADGFFKELLKSGANFIKDPTLKGLLGITAGTGAKVITNLVANMDNRTMRLIWDVPEAQTYLKNIINSSLTKNRQNLIRHSVSLDRLFIEHAKGGKGSKYTDASEYTLD